MSRTIKLSIIPALFFAVTMWAGAALSNADEGEPVAEYSNDDCLGCHGEKDLEAVTEHGKDLELFVEANHLEESVHAGFSCTDCHGPAEDFEDAPHNGGKPVKLKCADCHEAVYGQYIKSIHGIWHEKGDAEAASCGDCHTNHRILSSDDRESSTNNFNLHKTCAKCHQNGKMLETHDVKYKDAVENFVDSIHGKALLIDGLVVAPTCNNCHGVHDILPASHPDSRVSKNMVPKTCGECHALVEDTYDESVHGRLHENHDSSGPVCVTCHPSHQRDIPSGPEFRLHADRMCGQCHADRLVGYRDTFHGKALALGRSEVAACFDCHGHHDIQESSNPASRISAERRTETCRQCHPSANDNFANSLVHADHTDKERYPILYYVFWFMTLLLVGTFAFFAVHSLFWLFRSMALYMSDSKEFRKTKEHVRGDAEEFIRFRPVDRFLHGLIIISFLLLVITGMPLKFFYTDWAKVLLHIMGGQAVAAVLHRVGALITGFYFAVHISHTIYSFIGYRAHFRDPDTGKFSIKRMIGVIFGPDSPMPRFQDVRDIIDHNLWFFGKHEKPQFDRWTYWEKFDYLAVFWGVAVIGLSGLIMWFPTVFTLVLPGWAINVALVIHSDEALLAAGFIFTFHFFNVHFRPEKFPMDPVIFSGKISKAELLEERKKLYDRWEESGELDSHRSRDEWESWKWIMLPAGFIAFCIGAGLVVLIYYAMFSRLLGG